MKTLLASLAFLGVASLTSFARLGETEAACEVRYGKSVATVQILPEQLADSRKEYVKEGIKVRIAFWKDRAVEVVYDAESLRNLSEEGILILLAANAGGSEWTLVEDGPPRRISSTRGRIRSTTGFTTRWNRKDGVAKAFFDPNNGLSISDNAFQDALKERTAALAAAAAAAEKNRLKGF